MSKTLSTNAKALIDNETDLNLVTVLKISFSTAVWYADEEFTFGATTAEGRILEVGPIRFNQYKNTSSSVGSVNVSLIDTDETLLALFENNKFAGVRATLYQAFNNTQSDFVTLYDGVIASPVEYNEVDRVLSFEINPPTDTELAPFAPTEEGSSNADSNTHKDLYGTPFPIGFGSVVDCAAPLVSRPDFLKIRTSIDESNGIYVYCETEPFDDDNPFLLNTTYNFLMDREYIKGKFGTGSQSKRLQITSRNQVRVSGSTVIRPTVGTDPDSARKDVFWTNASNRLVGLWVKIGTVENYCVSQIAGKCFFATTWASAYGGGKNFTATRYSTKNGTRWNHSAGTPFKRLSSSANRNHYIVTGGKTSSGNVKRVRAWRNIPVIGGPQDAETVRELVKVPNAYYTVYYNSSLYQHNLKNITNHRPTYIEFKPPLSDRMQGWEDNEVYVSYNSDFISTGDRNTAYQIQWLLETFTDLTVDSTSLATVANAVADFPSDFAIFDQRSPIDHAVNIAEQARIALIFIGTTVKMVYRSTGEPSSGDGDFSLTEDNVLDEGSSVVLQELEDMTTVISASYKESYAFPTEKKYIVKANTTQFGERVENIQFTIYQRLGLIKKTVDWMLLQKAYPYKRLNLVTTLPGFSFEPNDRPNVDANIASILGLSTSFRGRIEEISLDTETGLATLKIWTPVRDGDDSKSSSAWSSVSSPGSAVKAYPFGDTVAFPSSVSDDIEAVAVPLDGS